MKKPLIIPTMQFKDERGCFYESYKKSKFLDIGLTEDFVQDNHSISFKNVIRGMHYQWDRPMGKLVRVSQGAILDVVVDLQWGSPDYGKPFYFELGEHGDQLWVPPGFAHGFLALTETAHVQYKCSAEYNKSGEGGINPFDPDLAIKWPVSAEMAILSNKDLNSMSLLEYNKEPRFFWSE